MLVRLGVMVVHQNTLQGVKQSCRGEGSLIGEMVVLQEEMEVVQGEMEVDRKSVV